MARKIEAAEHIRFDQLIHEFGRWVHISFARGTLPRRDTRTIFKAGVYLPGIVRA